eukprot:TRINITY_DN25549_c0_g1_i2.p1 TRINITY_DN25549_c0_g1~~TRINITY_DN25549_c0_g1_i2.p1  ORF type:complete len:253 (+),score=41.53 TRINITY_DN25549_c0_g1_i2:101-859(+)
MAGGMVVYIAFPDSDTIAAEVGADATVADLVAIAAERSGRGGAVRLGFHGEHLHNTMSLADAGVSAEATVQVLQEAHDFRWEQWGDNQMTISEDRKQAINGTADRNGYCRTVPAVMIGQEATFRVTCLYEPNFATSIGFCSHLASTASTSNMLWSMSVTKDNGMAAGAHFSIEVNVIPRPAGGEEDVAHSVVLLVRMHQIGEDGTIILGPLRSERSKSTVDADGWHHVPCSPQEGVSLCFYVYGGGQGWRLH